MPNETVDEMLQIVAELTETMRQHQQAVSALGTVRRGWIRKLRAAKTPYRVIAQSCRVTDQALFADLRKHPE